MGRRINFPLVVAGACLIAAGIFALMDVTPQWMFLAAGLNLILSQLQR
jgi:hypothetical protein